MIGQSEYGLSLRFNGLLKLEASMYKVYSWRGDEIFRAGEAEYGRDHLAVNDCFFVLLMSSRDYKLQDRHYEGRISISASHTMTETTQHGRMLIEVLI